MDMYSNHFLFVYNDTLLCLAQRHDDTGTCFSSISGKAGIVFTRTAISRIANCS